jgi:septal ring factor EnvC (AmiA/AmiB activator)
MSFRRRTIPTWVVAGAVSIAAGLGLAAIPMSSAAQPSLGELHSQLGAVQAHEQSLASNISSLSQLISSLSSQIALVESREAAVRAELVHDRQALAAVQAALVREQQILAQLRAQLARARTLLARQLVSNYEQAKPNLVSVVLDSNGFNDLLDKLTYLSDAQKAQQSMITVTTQAKDRADAAAAHLAVLRATDRQITIETVQRVAALASMNQLLHSRQTELAQARVAQQNALVATQNRGAQIQAEIGQIEAAQAAAERAAAARAAALAAQQQAPAGGGGGGGSGFGGSATPTPNGPTYGAGGGWTIPYSVVQCESGGQDLTPNSAGASGYYQIIPGSWNGYGGYSQAYQAPKSLQDQRASQLWNGGSGASNWTCAGIVGIH